MNGVVTPQDGRDPREQVSCTDEPVNAETPDAVTAVKMILSFLISNGTLRKLEDG